ncbi:hypothetical protein So717_26020 [Roseobacter cerasinus]|uniref:Arginine transporter n=1 Tax=Roseobacter cerasinus TaxID=2602289 RepID=A0A640VS54_9RHOB|nr:hypothetical protein [Roseobacter cerasinus]GFE50849.1 hypothetical protein So717_26020 [Roseobacter cerasinus]
MLRTAVLFCTILILSACGGRDSSRTEPLRNPPPLPVAGGQPQIVSGPINSACLAQRRRGATQERCGCIQAAANQSLSRSQQRQGVQFFDDPGQLQEVRQSGSESNRAFWDAWKRFAETAETVCGGI